MFSGIVQACVSITKIEKKKGLSRMTLDIGSLAKGVRKGTSVSVAGVCLTAVEVSGKKISFELMNETLDRTTLGAAREGNRVNVERSVRLGDEIGGHIVSGHVDGTAAITKIEKPENNHIITFECPDLLGYIFPKGFIALDGTSLTVVDVNRKTGTFTVHFIPETLKVTTFGSRKEGDRVNVEVDRMTMAVVETIRATQK
ncbi:MAG: riboflavin synthase [archaeon GW2011_AR5]|nr:MAG: riboflavin synthase [archaeon GW2011_AR5]